MRSFIFAALLISNALATPTTTTRRPVDNGAVLGRRLTTAETLTMSRMARGEDPNKCLFLKDSNSPLSPTSLTDQVQGIKFKATDALQGVTLQTCGDGRDCARLVKCSSPHPKICLEAQECFDPLGKNRCIELTECQCLQGSFSLANAPVGFRFEPANSIVDPGLDIPINEQFVPAVFKREDCFDGETFNLRACAPMESGCESIVPCLEDSGENCQKFVSGS